MGEVENLDQWASNENKEETEEITIECAVIVKVEATDLRITSSQQS